MMNKLLKRTVSLMTAVAILLSSLPAFAAAGSKTADWALYVYMCGADLESGGGCSTNDLIEMLDAEIPDNVRVIVMTGGASGWDSMEAGKAYYSGIMAALGAERNGMNMVIT